MAFVCTGVLLAVGLVCDYALVLACRNGSFARTTTLSLDLAGWAGILVGHALLFADPALAAVGWVGCVLTLSIVVLAAVHWVESCSKPKVSCADGGCDTVGLDGNRILAV